MKRRRRNKSGLDYTILTPVDVYDHVVKGTILTFPNGYVIPENMKVIIREVLLNRQRLTREEICNNISVSYLRGFNLGGAIKVFDTNIYSIVSYCFPEMEIKPWELRKLQNGFWQDEKNIKEFLLWIVEKEKINVESIESLRRIDAKLIRKYGANRILKCKGGIFYLIKLVSKVDVREWQVKRNTIWTEEKAKEAIKWLIEEKLKWSHSEVIEKLSAKSFKDNYLGGMLSKFCNNSPIRALDIAYPGEYTRVKRTILKK